MEFDPFLELNDESSEEVADAVSVDLILPNDLLERILACLPVASIFKAGYVCKRWHAIVSSERSLRNFFSLPSQKPWYIMFTSSDELLVMHMILSFENDMVLTFHALRYPVGLLLRHVG